MLKKLLDKKKQEGFTIVEVMIVLAIAGLIILVVFLAVPALQRNSRNTQRNNDAALIASAVNECLNSRNGSTATTGAGCGVGANLKSFLDTSKLRQLNPNATTVTVTANATTGGSDTSAIVSFARKCNAEGSQAEPGNARQGVVLFHVEGASGTVQRCLEV